MTKMTQCLSHQASTSSDENRAIILADDSFSSSTQPEDSIEFIAEVTGSNPGVFYLLDLVLFNVCFNYLLTWGYVQIVWYWIKKNASQYLKK